MHTTIGCRRDVERTRVRTGPRAPRVAGKPRSASQAPPAKPSRAGVPGAVAASPPTSPLRMPAELEAEQLRRELAHMSRVTTMGQLAASIAHELNQPLTGALTNAQAALRFLGSDPESAGEVREMLSDIAEDVRRAAEVIRRLRSMLEAGVVESVDVDLNRTVAEVLDLVGYDAVLNDVRLETELDSSLPPVRGDRIQLQQVLLNLVVNGIEAVRGSSPIRRRLTIRTLAEDKCTARVAISDDGPGIEAANLHRIFEPFFTTKGKGLGMGLSIAETIARAHGGRLWATNNETGGATFVLTLPFASPVRQP